MSSFITRMTVSFPTDATELNPIKCKNDKKHLKCSLYDSFTRFQVKIFTFKDRPKFKWIFTKSFHCSEVPNFHAYNLNTCIVKFLIKTVPHTKIFMDHFYGGFMSIFGALQSLVTTYVHCLERSSALNYSFHVPWQKIISHTGLEQYESETLTTEFSYLDELLI